MRAKVDFRQLELPLGPEEQQIDLLHFYRTKLADKVAAEHLWMRIRDEVLERDGWKCQAPGCQETQNLHIHHIKPRSTHPWLAYDLTNLCALCHYHHCADHAHMIARINRIDWRKIK